MNQLYIPDGIDLDLGKFSFERYTDPLLPSIFVGLESCDSLELLRNHQSFGLVILIHDKWNDKLIETTQNSKDLYLVSANDAISQKLQESCMQYIKHDESESLNNFLEKLLNHSDPINFIKYDINYYFDKIIVLNMDKDVRKWSRILELFEKNNISNYIRFSATDGSKEPVLSDFEKIKNTQGNRIQNSRVLGTLYSFVNVLEYSKKMNYERILFLEDDIIFIKNFRGKFYELCNSVPDDWKLLCVGSNDGRGSSLKLKGGVFYHPVGTIYGAFALGINSSIYDEFIAMCQLKKLPPDSFFNVSAKHRNDTYISSPNLIIADVSSSALRKKFNMKAYSKSRGWDLEEYDM